MESIPRLCADMEKMGLDFKWYIVGFGPDNLIQEALDKYKMRHRMILLGKKSNPYPYVKACDVYVQPSIFEGKSVTVREAQVLCKPTVITNYPTAKSQINDNVDGVIVPLDEENAAKGIADFLKNPKLQKEISDYLASNDFGNESEVEKVYSLMN